MVRSLRVEYSGAVYHVLNRGNYRKPVFETPEAKQVFEDCLFRACERYGWRLYWVRFITLKVQISKKRIRFAGRPWLRHA